MTGQRRSWPVGAQVWALRVWAVAVATFLGLFTLTGCGGATHPPRPASVASVATPAASPAVAHVVDPGSQDAATAISLVREAMAGTGVTGASVVRHGGRADITVALANLVDDGQHRWVADLAAGAIGERIRRPGDRSMSDVVRSAEATGQNEGGVQETVDIGVGGAQLGQRFASPSDAALRSRAAQVAARLGLTIESIKVLHPLDAALAVTLQEPEGYRPPGLPFDTVLASLGGSPRDVEGVYLVIRSPSGQMLIEGGQTARLGTGYLSFAPGQDSVWPANHG